MTLRDDWTVNGKTYAKGALLSFAVCGAAGRRHRAGHAGALRADGPRESIEDIATGRGAVYASIYNNVTGSIHAFRPNADAQRGATRSSTCPPTARPTSFRATISAAKPPSPSRAISKPPTLYFDSGDGKLEAIKSLPARFDASGLVTEQFEATSSDGTKIPYFVTRREGSERPCAHRALRLWRVRGFADARLLGQFRHAVADASGGIYVVANIRGGGEFGPAWHQAALKENRQKAFDDFAAVAADLEKRGITTPKQLGIMGGSNGGLLVSTVMTQHPELIGAVVCQVPLIDMIRYTQIGAGASWEGEYGDPADPAMRAAILKYSPYQNVSAAKTYPPVFFVTATSDDRVTPVHARKMAAKMEAQGHDVMFFENTDGGHSASAKHKQAAEMWALSFIYLKQKLGLK